MVDILKLYLDGVYKPTYKWGSPHCMGLCMFYLVLYGFMGIYNMMFDGFLCFLYYMVYDEYNRDMIGI